MTKQELHEALHRAETSLIQAWSANTDLRKRNGELRCALNEAFDNGFISESAVPVDKATIGLTRTHAILEAVNAMLAFHDGKATVGEVKYAASQVANYFSNAQRQQEAKKMRAAKARAGKS